MLQFNGKTRKGKAYGLPYQGGKRKVAKHIIEILKQNFDTTKTVCDVFGGGAISFECVLNGIDVVYNDSYTDLVNALEWLMTYRGSLHHLVWSREQFMAVRNNPTHPPEEWLGILINSFGQSMRSYLYSVEKSEIKYRYAKLILDTYGTGKDYRHTELYREFLKEYYQGRDGIEQLERLEKVQDICQLFSLKETERLQQLEYLLPLERLNRYPALLQFHNRDYKAFSHVEDAIFYLDPPYENANIQGYKHISDFDSQTFYDWCVEMASKNDVLISSYTISDPRFECVYEFTKTTSTLQGGNSGKAKHMERLWMVKPEYRTGTVPDKGGVSIA